MKSFILGTMVICFFQGCGSQGGSDVGNPASLHFVGINDATLGASALTLESGIEISRAQIVLGRIRLRGAGDCTGSNSNSNILKEGPYVVNLLSDASIPEVGNLGITDGSYCRIELRMDKLEADEVPSGVASDLSGHSLLIEGFRPSDNKAFQVTLDIDAEFKLENLSGFSLSSTQDIFIAFNLATWFSGVDLSTADLSSNIAIIDKDHNDSLLDLIEENVKRSAKLFKDSDGDGHLDDSESETPEAEGSDD